jgi:periplasmic mercuric ion binding protein
MKTMFKMALLLFFLAGISQVSMAQEPLPKEKEIKIQTSAICGMCKEKIETNMAFEKGVKSVELDEESKILEITYRTSKTTPEKLRKAVSELGYDADDVEADPVAYEKLPPCCKKGVDPH